MPTITPLDASFGAVVTDIKVADMDAAEWRAVEDAFHEYAALVFPDQHPSEEEQIAFGERFGDIELLRPDPAKKAVPITNLKDDGSLYTKDEFRFKTLRGNEGWHTDSSYMPLAAKASILSAIQVPSKGGETALSDMRDAYDKLDAETLDKIKGLSAYHSLYQSQAKNGFTFKTGEGYGYHTKGAPLRPLVKTHPVTRRKSLFIGRHAFEIPGMSRDEAQALLDDLLDFAVRPPRVYKHQWKTGDIMMWDNRCILHRACPYDHSEIRIMRHVRVAGEPESELVETGRDDLADDFQPSASNR
ncbi:MAG: TauD/TfdA family dioxygenase [Pseudomonadota bacterium]|nr:TauD/TfdA family dioxygenase [Pseudomonadota bacterium]